LTMPQLSLKFALLIPENPGPFGLFFVDYVQQSIFLMAKTAGFFW
jgi:hypothetical protein